MTILFLSTCIPNLVFASSENWVEVENWDGNGSLFGYSSPFDINHIEWRIRWEYTPMSPVGSQNDLIFSVVPEENKIDGNFNSSQGIASVNRPSEQNGTLHFNNSSGRFYLHFAPGYIYWKIIIEENVDSIPEFPSWAVLPILLVGSFSIIVLKKKRFKNR